MLTSLVFTAWMVLAAPVVTAFSFTTPTPGTALNLSAPTIDIQWAPENAQYSQFDLAFEGQSAKGTGFSYTIAQNLSVPEGHYTWHPSNVSAALENSKVTLTPGSNYYFKAELHDSDSSAGAQLSSGNYAVTGYQHISAALHLQPHLGAALLVVASLSIALSGC
ncbi:uncharacterized protein RCC_06748 [Ramularia collo-cygni]|uniref:Fibronectin type-III domain-containing protein n=1 Tax=Ramularia collo-cygni TaxID=112498 RepID=A0A2D3UZG4_9PEZI|nr:uncharacterized protein RCC_06748 [Ramularia collo-cygni]CZT20888.1 uncharacterized protein RCC_06748 [Ramularia collo-cygni]